MSGENISDTPFVSTELKDNSAFVAALEDYLFAAATSNVAISGNIYNVQGQTIGTYSTTLAWTATSNAGYLLNQVKLSTILLGATWITGFTYIVGNAGVGEVSGPVGIDIPIAALSNIVYNTGARTGLNITTVSPLLNANTPLGRVAT
jgi:hypothetical protein